MLFAIRIPLWIDGARNWILQAGSKAWDERASCINGFFQSVEAVMALLVQDSWTAPGGQGCQTMIHVVANIYHRSDFCNHYTVMKSHVTDITTTSAALDEQVVARIKDKLAVFLKGISCIVNKVLDSITSTIGEHSCAPLSWCRDYLDENSDGEFSPLTIPQHQALEIFAKDSTVRLMLVKFEQVTERA